jgi:hypothetical protein
MSAPNEVYLVQAARHLAQHVPLHVGAIDEHGNPVGWNGWQNTPIDPTVMDRWRPGLAVGAVCGVVFDVLDIDPRHGGDESVTAMRETGMLPRLFGRDTTPRGGAHYYIAKLGVGSRDGIFPGVDLKGGRPDGTGRGFVFIGPTQRKGGTYTWGRLPDLDALAEGDETGEALADYARSLKGGESWDDEPAPRRDGPPPTGRQKQYLNRLVAKSG